MLINNESENLAELTRREMGHVFGGALVAVDLSIITGLLSKRTVALRIVHSDDVKNMF